MERDDERFIAPISARQFELYALSLERGPNFESAQIFSDYRGGKGIAAGCTPIDPSGTPSRPWRSAKGGPDPRNLYS